MCRSQAAGGRRCRGSSLALRRAVYAVRSSAAAKKVNQALADGSMTRNSPAHEAFERAQTSALRARLAVIEGDDEKATQAALDAKADMNRAARLLARFRQSQQDRDKETRATNAAIDQDLERVNPNFQPGQAAYSVNCTSVCQAHELRRRGQQVQAGPIEPGQNGRSITVIEAAWGAEFTFTHSSSKEVAAAFSEPGSRGIVYTRWSSGGAHVFNVENVDGTVRFVDGQPTPHVTDASGYFKRATVAGYMRVDHLPTPTAGAMERYLAT
ncbi:toxin glutamine deamidase domain-containing protein [Streptacidiphilus sp. EB103A]|uniref:toxin glutamine deamidase domain-containing protein n=1 Tax=Streptacidiphilus sp. EB103A TaxID=3156275 RepID=UPI0035124848